MTMKRITLLLVVSTGIALPARLASAAPAIGDKAPAVKVARWVNHEPPALPGGKDANKHVFLVEFWATWCPPCKKSIPHLAKLHEKHEKDGLVILGISNEDSSKVSRFVDKKMKMPYYVGVDDEMATNNTYMKNIPGIPHAFLVDRSGTVVWAGNPLADTTTMDSAIQKVLAGHYDIEAAKNAALTSKKFEELMKSLQPAYQAGDKDKLFETLDKLIALKPMELQPYLIKRQLLARFDMADKVPELNARIESAFKDSSESLLELVKMDLKTPLSDRDPACLWRVAKRADTLTKHRDPEVLVILARVQCELGMIDSAIETQARAVEFAPPDEIERFKSVLAYFKAARRVAQQATAHPPSDEDE